MRFCSSPNFFDLRPLKVKERGTEQVPRSYRVETPGVRIYLITRCKNISRGNVDHSAPRSCPSDTERLYKRSNAVPTGMLREALERGE